MILASPATSVWLQDASGEARVHAYSGYDAQGAEALEQMRLPAEVVEQLVPRDPFVMRPEDMGGIPMPAIFEPATFAVVRESCLSSERRDCSRHR